MAGIFARIANGEIPSYKIAETENCFAFLDLKPLAKGHTLIIPKQEIDYIFDLPPELYIELHTFSQTIAKAIFKAIPCKKIGMAVIGLEVPHAHIHLVPMQTMHDLNFSNSRLEFSEVEYKDIAKLIQAKL
ncbi:MAG: HIT family protein [Saprospiraceae bacterium]|jgi:histidine triad (HIT) family protein|nr:HIT family protein [Saprospiraceae bacterium]MBK7465511.1 HIT family protein [Saprospiraceae bacterium]MBK9992474.1 HIT family protein [Saprospiraceae bacterium]